MKEPAESRYVIEPKHRIEQDLAHKQALMLLDQGQAAIEVINFLRIKYKDLWYKWRVMERRRANV